MRTITVIAGLLLIVSQEVVGQVKRERMCFDEVVRHLSSVRDTMYIEERRHLERVAGLRTKSNTATLNGTTSAGQKISFSVRLGQYDPRHQHPAMPVFGTDGTRPRMEMREFAITWNGTRLHIPSSAYANLYEFHLPSIETYISHKTGCMYVYLTASDGASAYSVKFVFSRKGFVTRLISTNECTDGFDCLDAIPTTCYE